MPDRQAAGQVRLLSEYHVVACEHGPDPRAEAAAGAEELVYGAHPAHACLFAEEGGEAAAGAVALAPVQPLEHLEHLESLRQRWVVTLVGSHLYIEVDDVVLDGPLLKVNSPHR